MDCKRRVKAYYFLVGSPQEFSTMRFKHIENVFKSRHRHGEAWESETLGSIGSPGTRVVAEALGHSQSGSFAVNLIP